MLSYLPQEMLSISGSAPRQFPNVRKGGTWSVYFLEQTAARKTRLRLVVAGWQSGREWSEAFDYFLKNNAVFLNGLWKELSKQTT